MSKSKKKTESTSEFVTKPVLADAGYKPILFSTPMVKAILNETKTQTRRQVKGMALDWLNDGFTPEFVAMKENGFGKANIGDIFWVRETFGRILSFDKYCYKADVESNYDKPALGWKPSIFMPKNACRIWLEVTGRRIERLKDITKPDAVTEGIIYDETFKKYECYSCKKYHKGIFNLCEDGFFENPIKSFCSLWQSINANWEENPFIWVYSFKRVECPIGFR